LKFFLRPLGNEIIVNLLDCELLDFIDVLETELRCPHLAVLLVFKNFLDQTFLRAGAWHARRGIIGPLVLVQALIGIAQFQMSLEPRLPRRKRDLVVEHRHRSCQITRTVLHHTF
jgi:hypothetical protein